MHEEVFLRMQKLTDEICPYVKLGVFNLNVIKHSMLEISPL